MKLLRYHNLVAVDYQTNTAGFYNITVSGEVALRHGANIDLLFPSHLLDAEVSRIMGAATLHTDVLSEVGTSGTYLFDTSHGYAYDYFSDAYGENEARGLTVNEILGILSKLGDNNRDAFDAVAAAFNEGCIVGRRRQHRP